MDQSKSIQQKFECKGYSPFVKTLKTDHGARLEVDLLPESIAAAVLFSQAAAGMYKITFERIPK